MHFRKDRSQGEALLHSRSRRWKRVYMGWVLAIAAGVASSSYASSPTPQQTVNADKTQVSQDDRSPETKQKPSDAEQNQAAMTRDDREKQVTEDSARLLKLAKELKAEADKTTIDTLSLTVIRKAEAVEKLARDVKTKIKNGQQQKTGANR